jgi:hypothetical protein
MQIWARVRVLIISFGERERERTREEREREGNSIDARTTERYFASASSFSHLKICCF